MTTDNNQLGPASDAALRGQSVAHLGRGIAAPALIAAASVVAAMLVAACNEAGPPSPRWIRKANEFDREKWGLVCGAEIKHTISGSDRWSSPDGEAGLPLLCSLDWSEDYKTLEGMSVHASQRGAQPGAERTIEQGLRLIYPEVPAGVQAAIRDLVSVRKSANAWVGGFTIRRRFRATDGTSGRPDSESVEVLWDPHRIHLQD